MLARVHWQPVQMLRREWDRLVHSVENHSLGVAEQNGLFIACMGLAGLFGTTQYLSIKKLKDETRRISTALKAVGEQAARRNGAWHNLELKADTLEAKHNSMVDVNSRQNASINATALEISRMHREISTLQIANLHTTRSLRHFESQMTKWNAEMQGVNMKISHMEAADKRIEADLDAVKEQLKAMVPCATNAADLTRISTELRTLEAAMKLRDKESDDLLRRMDIDGEKSGKAIEDLKIEIKSMKDDFKGKSLEIDLSNSWFKDIEAEQIQMENRVDQLCTEMQEAKDKHTVGLKRTAKMRAQIRTLSDVITRMQTDFNANKRDQASDTLRLKKACTMLGRNQSLLKKKQDAFDKDSNAIHDSMQTHEKRIKDQMAQLNSKLHQSHQECRRTCEDTKRDLMKQASIMLQRARDMEKLKEETYVAEAHVLKDQISDIQTKLSQQQACMNDEKDKVMNMRQRLMILEREQQYMLNELALLKSDMRLNKEKMVQYEDKAERLKTQILRLEERVHTNESGEYPLLNQLKAELKDVQVSIQQHKAQMRETRAKIAEQKRKNAQTSTALKQLREKAILAYNSAQGLWKTQLPSASGSPRPHSSKKGTPLKRVSTHSGSSSSTSTSTASDFTNDLK